LLSKLNASNIIKLHASFADQKNVYFVLDFAINGDLSEFLKRNSKLTRLKVLRLARFGSGSVLHSTDG
jgi:serine/threonine protein kinase